MKQGTFLKISALVWGILSVLMIAGMVLYQNLYINAYDTTSAYMSSSQINSEEQMVDEENYVPYTYEMSDDGKSRIQIPQGASSNQISLKNDYLNRCIYLYIENTDSDFYAAKPSFFIGEEISGVYYYRGAQQDLFILPVTDLYECSSSVINGEVVLNFVLLTDCYDHIVVVDILTDQYDKTEQAEKLCEVQLLSLSQKIIFTNHNGSGFTEEKWKQLVRDSKADYVIQILTRQADNGEETGMWAYYQERYYVNGFGSIDLADCLERNIVTEVSGTANGLAAVGNDDILNELGTSSARIVVGSYANEVEAVMLDSELFWEKVGTGVYKTLLTAYGISE